MLHSSTCSFEYSNVFVRGPAGAKRFLSFPEVTVGRKEEHGVELDRDLECAQDAEHEQRPGDGEDGEPHDVEPEALGDLRER